MPINDEIVTIGNREFLRTAFTLVNLKPKIKNATPTSAYFGIDSQPRLYREYNSSTKQVINEFTYYFFGINPGKGKTLHLIKDNSETSPYCGATDESDQAPNLRDNNDAASIAGANYEDYAQQRLSTGTREFKPQYQEILRLYEHYKSNIDAGQSGKAEQYKLYVIENGTNVEVFDANGINWQALIRKFPYLVKYTMDAGNERMIEAITGQRVLIRAGTIHETVTYTKGLWQLFKEQGMSDTNIRRELIEAGYTESQIAAALKIRTGSSYQVPDTPPSGGTPGTGGRGPGSGSPDTGANDSSRSRPQTVTITVSRGRNLFASDEVINSQFATFRSSVTADEPLKPMIFQVYPKNETQPVSADISNDANAYEYRRYTFTHAPNEIQYSGIGSDWTTVDRAGGFPFIDWKSFKLLQVSFSFVIAEQFDGIEVGIDERIKNLRAMAQAPYPVRLYNFDKMLTEEQRYDAIKQGRLIQFAITDISITGQQRNKDQQLTRAQASMTLQELPPDKTPLIQMPRLVHKDSSSSPPDETAPNRFVLFSEGLGGNFGVNTTMTWGS